MLDADGGDFLYLRLEILFPNSKAVIEHAVQKTLLCAIFCSFKFRLHGPGLNAEGHTGRLSVEINIGLELFTLGGNDIRHIWDAGLSAKSVTHLYQLRRTFPVEPPLGLSLKNLVPFLKNRRDDHSRMLARLSAEFHPSDLAHFLLGLESKHPTPPKLRVHQVTPSSTTWALSAIQGTRRS